jgi:hypothetical protein
MSVIRRLEKAEAERDALRAKLEAVRREHINFVNWVIGASAARLDPIMEGINDRARDVLAATQGGGDEQTQQKPNE